MPVSVLISLAIIASLLANTVSPPNGVINSFANTASTAVTASCLSPPTSSWLPKLHVRSWKIDY